MPGQHQSGQLIDLRDTPALPENVPAGLETISLTGIQRGRGKDWLHSFSRGLGDINSAHSGVAWWAYTSTAKNLLSSPLGNRLFQALAVVNYMKIARFETLYVVGATTGQRVIIELAAENYLSQITIHNIGRRAEFSNTEIVLRLLYQAIHIACVQICWRDKFKLIPADVYAFTYADANVSEDADTYFGELHRLLSQRDPAIKLSYIAFIQAPYRKVLPKLNTFRKRACCPLLLSLSMADLWWALKRSLSASRVKQNELPDISSIPGTRALLAEAFRWDVAKGGYFYNLLVFKAMCRFASRHSPKRMLYPFENKSIEKLLLYALRETCPTCRIVGYQHTSITPRHTTFQLSDGESRTMPLPDFVVTAGDITRRHLESSGNFPGGMFKTGCALRQRRAEVRVGQGTPNSAPFRVLLALSSSRLELIAAVEFMRAVAKVCNHLEIGVRPHPEFPLSLLPTHLRDWVAANTMDFSGSALADNIEWCSVTAYVSSTVALESLMLGKPVINLDLGELVVPDPVLESPPLWRRVSDPQNFPNTLDLLLAAQPQQSASDQIATIEYTLSYFRPVTADAIEVFLS